MKVMQINGVIHNGSTGAIVDAIDQCLAEHGEDYLVAYGIGEKVSDGIKFCYRYEQALYRRYSMLTGYRFGFAPLSTRRLIKYIKRYQPDVVNIHSINGNCVDIFQLLAYLKKANIATVVTNHAEFFYTGNCTSTYGCQKYRTGCHGCEQLKWASDSALFPKTEKAWMKMKEAFSNFQQLVVVSVSEYSRNCAQHSPILADYRHEVILNGIDTSIFKPQFTIDIRMKYHLNAKRLGVFVTSAFSLSKDHLKGGYWLLELAKHYEKVDFQFIVVGCDDPGVHMDNVVFAGRIHDKELLANIYAQANIALSFSRAESFGMTCAEALCCGTPVAGFLCGGAESVALKPYSRFADYGDIEMMMNYIDEMIKGYAQQRAAIADSAQQTYASQRMVENYYQLYKQLNACKKRVKKV